MRKGKHNLYALLAKDIDLAGTEFTLVRANGK